MTAYTGAALHERCDAITAVGWRRDTPVVFVVYDSGWQADTIGRNPSRPYTFDEFQPLLSDGSSFSAEPGSERLLLST